ncbi:putative glycoprotein [Kander virus]|uniref:Glycoprotein n=1 Tax=Kander virus TaxID=2883639 RepID=A0ABY3P9I9_9MONO|nr:putative glycoprotein [Kander virus]UCU83238.1 putative glycoprotein [Kander virus]
MGGAIAGVIFVSVWIISTTHSVEVLVGDKGKQRKTIDFKADIKSAVVFPRWGLLLKPQREMVLTNGHIVIPVTVELGHGAPDISSCGADVYNNITGVLFEKVARLNARSLEVMGELERIGTGSGLISEHPRTKRSLAIALMIGKTLASVVSGGWKIYNALSRGRELRELRDDLAAMDKRVSSRLSHQDSRIRALKKILFTWHGDYERTLSGFRLFAKNIACDLGKLEAEVQVGRWAERWDRVITSLMIQPLNNHLVGGLFQHDMLSGVFDHLDSTYGPSNPFSSCPECTLATMTVSHVGGTPTSMNLALELPNMVERQSYLVMEPSYYPVRVGDGVDFIGHMERTLVVKDGRGYSLDTTHCEGSRSMMTCDVSVVNMRSLGSVKEWNLDSEITMRSTPVDPQYWLSYPMYDSLLVYAAADGTCRVKRKTGQYMTLPQGLQQLSSSDGDFAECGGYTVHVPQGAQMTPLSVYGSPPVLRSLDYHEQVAVKAGALSGQLLQDVLDDDKTSEAYDMYMSDNRGQGRVIAANQAICLVLLLVVIGVVIWLLKNRKIIRDWWAGVGLFGLTLHGILRRRKNAQTSHQTANTAMGTELAPLN